MARINTIDLAVKTISGLYTGGGTQYLVETPLGVQYRIYIDPNSDPVFDKSVDYGSTWSAITQLKAITCTQIAVWYDRWTDPTGTLGNLIHVVYTDSGADDVFYRTINTESGDALGTERTVFAGASTASGGALSVSRMIGGNVIIAGSIDAGVEVFAKKSSDYFASSSDISNPYEASPDKLILLPGWGADNQDAMCFYYDASASEVSVKYYDDSANSWSEASIATTITMPDHTSTTFGHWSATVDHANSRNVLTFWTNVDTAAASLKCFTVTQSSSTEVTAVVSSSTDDQGFCAISIFGSSWYVWYCGSTDGADTYSFAMWLYYKVSTDSGSTWGSETKFGLLRSSTSLMFGKPITYKLPSVVTLNNTPSILVYTTQISSGCSHAQLGM